MRQGCIVRTFAYTEGASHVQLVPGKNDRCFFLTNEARASQAYVDLTSSFRRCSPMKTMTKMIFHKTTNGIDRWKSGKRRVRCEMPDLRDRSIREARESPRLLQPREATLHDAIARHHRFVTAYSTFGRTTAWLLNIAPKSNSHSAAQPTQHPP